MASPGAVPGADDVESSDPYVVRARLVREAVQTLRNRVGASELTRVYLTNVDSWEKSLVERAPKLAALTTALYKSASRLTDPLHREAHDVFVRAIDMTRTAPPLLGGAMRFDVGGRKRTPRFRGREHRRR